MNHDEDYAPEYLAGILNEVKTIAMVGASSDATKFSYGVLRVLHETGYDMIPVNPREAGKEIRGLKCYETLASIERPVDMVQVFRTSEAAYQVTEEAIAIGAKVVWMQMVMCCFVSRGRKVIVRSKWASRATINCIEIRSKARSDLTS